MQEAAESAIADRLSDPETINALLGKVYDILEQARDTIRPYINNASIFSTDE